MLCDQFAAELERPERARRQQLAADAEYTGEQSAIDPDTGLESELPAAGRLNVQVRRAWPMGSGWMRSLEARATFENLTDAVQYDAFGLPLPGRGVRLEFSVN